MGNSPSQAEFHPPTLTPPQPRSVSVNANAGGGCGLAVPNSSIQQQQQKQSSSHSAPSRNLIEQGNPLKQHVDRSSTSSSITSPSAPMAQFDLPQSQAHEKSPFSWGNKTELEDKNQPHSIDSLLVLDSDPLCSIRTEDLSPSSLSPQPQPPRLSSTARRKAGGVGVPFHHPLELLPLSESDPNNAMVQSGYEVKDDRDVLSHYDGPYEYEKDSLELECPYRHPVHPSLEEDSITSSTTSNTLTQMVLNPPTPTSPVEEDVGQGVSGCEDSSNVGGGDETDNLSTTTAVDEMTPCPSESEDTETITTEPPEDRESPSSSGFISDLDPSSLQTIQIQSDEPQPQPLVPYSSLNETETKEKSTVEGIDISKTENIIPEVELNQGLDVDVGVDPQNMHINPKSEVKNEDAKIPIAHEHEGVDEDQCSAPIPVPIPPTETQLQCTDTKPEEEMEMQHVHQIRESEPIIPTPHRSLSSLTPQNENMDLMQLETTTTNPTPQDEENANHKTKTDEIDLDQGKKPPGCDANKYISVIQISGCSPGGSVDVDDTTGTIQGNEGEPPTLQVEPPALIDIEVKVAQVEIDGKANVNVNVNPFQDIPQSTPISCESSGSSLAGKVVSTTLTRRENVGGGCGCGSDQEGTDGDLFTQICLEDAPQKPLKPPCSEPEVSHSPNPDRKRNEKPKLFESESLDEFESLEEQAAKAEIEMDDNVTLVPVNCGPSSNNKRANAKTNSISRFSSTRGPLVISCNNKPKSIPEEADTPTENVANIAHPNPKQNETEIIPQQSPSPMNAKVTSFASTNQDKEISSNLQPLQSDPNIMLMQIASPQTEGNPSNPQMHNAKMSSSSSINLQKQKHKLPAHPMGQKFSSFLLPTPTPPPPPPEKDNISKNCNNPEETCSTSPAPAPSSPNMNPNVFGRTNSGEIGRNSTPLPNSTMPRVFGQRLNGTPTPTPTPINKPWLPSTDTTYSINAEDISGSGSDNPTPSPTPSSTLRINVTYSKDMTPEAILTTTTPPVSFPHCSLPSFSACTGGSSPRNKKVFGLPGDPPRSWGHGSVKMNKIEDMSQTLEESTAEKLLLIKERDQALEDLNNVESAFADVHRKYERSKGILQNLKDNENALIQREQELMQKIENRDRKIELYKETAQEKLELMYQDYEQKIKEYEVENTRLRAQCRLMDMKLAALENDVEQKAKENAQLNALCNELISGQGNH